VHVASRYFEIEQTASGSTIFRTGDTADCIYVLESGSVTLLDTSTESSEHQQQKHRLLRYSNGGIFGELDFFLGQARSFNAQAESDCTLHVLQRDAYARMIEEEPVAGAALQSAVLKHLCLETHTMLRSGAL
jgi:CRP-like cAMP-binding protein